MKKEVHILKKENKILSFFHIDKIEVINGIAAGIPMKRLGTIEELGELASFLASSESSYITAQSIVIDGGSTLPKTDLIVK